MTKYLLLLTLMLPVFLVEQSDAGMRRPNHLNCYLIRGLVGGQFIHGWRYMTKEAAQLFSDYGLSLERKPNKHCDAFLDQDDD